jgi:hypothetical protein
MTDGAKMGASNGGGATEALTRNHNSWDRCVHLLPEKSGGLMRDALVNETHDILRRGAGEKDFRDAGFLQGRDVRFRDDAAEDYGYIVHPFVV